MHILHYRSAGGAILDADGNNHVSPWDVLQSGVWLTGQADPRDYDPGAARFDDSSALQLRLHDNH